jgi:hypothetical protein
VDSASAYEKWLGGRGFVFDLFLLLVPWLYFVFIGIWAFCFGPNSSPPWPILGDRISYDWSIYELNLLIGGGTIALALVRLVLHRRDIVILGLCIIGTPFATMWTGGMGFA